MEVHGGVDAIMLLLQLLVILLPGHNASHANHGSSSCILVTRGDDRTIEERKIVGRIKEGKILLRKRDDIIIPQVGFLPCPPLKVEVLG